MSKSITLKETHSPFNPIDRIEESVMAEDWAYHRSSPEEIILDIPGRWAEYRLQFIWQEDIRVLQLFSMLDMHIQPQTITRIYELLSLINDHIALGHFEISSEEAMPTYRYSLLIHGPTSFSTDYLENLIDIAILESERYYPAFQYVIWGGKSAKEAAAVSMLETVGEA